MALIQWPAKLPCVRLEPLLDSVTCSDGEAALAKLSNTARTNVVTFMRKHAISGDVIAVRSAHVVDCDVSPAYMKGWSDRLFCLLAGRTRGPWLCERNRRMNCNELLRCQGFNPCTFVRAVPVPALIRQLGNTMSVTLVGECNRTGFAGSTYRGWFEDG